MMANERLVCLGKKREHYAEMEASTTLEHDELGNAFLAYVCPVCKTTYYVKVE